MKPMRPRRERCPRCGSINTGKYCYGYSSPQMWEELKESDGALLIGGCRLDELNPTHFCHACRKDFGSYPIYVLKSAGKEENWCDTDSFSPDIGVRLFGMRNTFGDSILGATKVSFSVSGMGGTCAYSFEASQQDMKLLAVGDDGAYNPADKKVHTRQKKIDSTPDVFPDLVKKLFLKLHVADWKKRHFLEARDGTHWRLRIDLAEARYPLVISGSNAYPPYYERLLNLLRPFFHKQGLPFEGD